MNANLFLTTGTLHRPAAIRPAAIRPAAIRPAAIRTVGRPHLPAAQVSL